jgi:hypothetical protein
MSGGVRYLDAIQLAATLTRGTEPADLFPEDDRIGGSRPSWRYGRGPTVIKHRSGQAELGGELVSSRAHFRAYTTLERTLVL